MTDQDTQEDEQAVMRDKLLAGPRKFWAVITSAKAKLLYATAVFLPIFGACVYGSYLLFGALATILYVFLFAIGATMVPISIWLFGPSFPRSVSQFMGRMHFILGQMTLGGMVMVQQDNEWVEAPLRRVDGQLQCKPDDEWYDLTGEENLSMLGWKPFGIVRDKSDGPYADLTVDDVATDGGGGITRGNVTQVGPTATDHDGPVFDLKKVWTKGIQKIGGIDLIEKAEEIAMVKEAKQGTLSGYETMIASIVGLVLGIGTAAVGMGML